MLAANITPRAFSIIPINVKILQHYLPAILTIDRTMLAERWEAEHFILDRPGKWETSRLAFVGEELVGYMIATFKPQSVHVNRIAVSPVWRRCGIAVGLLREAAQAAIAVSKPLVTLKVACQNEVALNFYQRRGFTLQSAGDQTLSLQIAPQLLLEQNPNGLMA